MTPQELALQAAEFATEKKAEDIVILEMNDSSIAADYFVIATGGNRRQIQSISDDISKHFKRQSNYAPSVEGYDQGMWVLVDLGDIIVHVFNRETREFYDLETLWADAPKYNMDAFKKLIRKKTKAKS